MKLRNVFASALVMAIGSVALVPMASAAVTGDTAATFQVGGTGLAITVPVSAALGSVSTGASSVGGQLGAVTVTDGRGDLGANWTTTVTSTVFTTGSTSANETVALPNITYASGASTEKTGEGTFVPLTATAMNAAPAGRAVGFTAGNGVNSATWNPTLSFTLLSSQVKGTYAGTITHSVA